jgi:hypothetical protein
MSDRNDGLAFLKTQTHQAGATARPGKGNTGDEESGEVESCGAFGYLRGIRDRALALEFRYRDGNSEWLSYNLLASWRFDPSVGLLVKFTGDVVTLVLIRGSNLDALVGEGTVNLTDRGLQRHRILWVREMDEQELRRVGERGPTIDRIEVGEFESQEEAREWLKKVSPTFLRKPR